MKTLLFNDYKDSMIAKKWIAPDFIELLEFLTGYKKNLILNQIINNTFFQSVILNKASDKKDPQQNFHIDTFYPSFKFWFFPEAVSLDDAPFEYVEGSHCLPSKAVTHFSERYQDNALGSGYSISPDNMEGSLRATENDITRMGLLSKKVVVSANTLVIANVGGFHRRSLNTNNVHRNAIHSSIRPVNIYSAGSYVT